MITLTKSASNTVVVTLTEKTTIDPVAYLFVFINKMSGTSTTFTAEDISTHLSRYNEFVVVESGTEDLLNGTVNLEVGTYDYTVYQTSVTSPQSLDVTDASGIVEVGKVQVLPAAITEPVYYDATFTKNVKQWNP